MKTIGAVNSVENSEQFKSLQFGLKTKNLSNIIGLLRDDIYSDKVLAVIREYACNASDANVMSGKGNVPIVVTLPTKLSPEFKVRDYGTGLSMQDVEDIFISYGESTKRNTNDAVGTLGIGSKSGFCYGSNYLVTSFHDGTKTVYNCVLDASNVGQCLVLTRSRMASTDKEGVEITVPVKNDDVNLFVSKAKEFFSYWSVRPTLVNCNDVMAEVKPAGVTYEGKDSDWRLIHTNNGSYNDERSVAIMGNIAYPINWNVVRLTGLDEGVRRMFQRNRLVLRFDIGELQFAPSREALQYTDYTNAALSKKLKKVMSELETVVVEKFAACKDLIEAMALYGQTFEGYGALMQHVGTTFQGKLFWNKIAVNSSSVEEIDHHDAVKGYSKDAYSTYDNRFSWTPIMQMFEHRSSGLLRCHKDNYTCRRMDMSAAVGILLLDSTGPMYSRKAVRYLLTQNTTWKRVYVFKFETDKARKDAYEKLHLEQFPVVTYTSIAAEVKKSIIRVNRSTGKPQMTVRRTAERSVKSVAIGKSSDLSFYRYSNPIETVNVDLAKQTGYYIKGDGSTMCNIGGKSLSLEGGLQQANRMAFTCNSVLGTKIDKVYVFGKQIYDSKSNKTVLKNWTLIDTLQAQIDAYLVTNTSHLYDTAFNKISNDSRKFVYYHSMATALAKIGGIQNKNSPVLKLNGLIVKHSIHNRHSYSYRTKNAKALEVCTAITGLLHDKAADFKTQTRELQEVLAEINKQYPMLDMVTATEWDEATTKSSLMTITEYINKMDV